VRFDGGHQFDQRRLGRMIGQVIRFPHE
jgi:hypothetical protein